MGSSAKARNRDLTAEPFSVNRARTAAVRVGWHRHGTGHLPQFSAKRLCTDRRVPDKIEYFPKNLSIVNERAAVRSPNVLGRLTDRIRS